ncbi:unnamed protein product [Rhizoctonia solani]|uniref:Major facilitator superfamily (MFS) profile domain-containing protein n=1 Tax=Rhizoctonia solani TaxID=456999 RepID=A0A8H3AZQ2_9AGAM|nr:unnamed protein product [Rhizoctonia solani]
MTRLHAPTYSRTRGKIFPFINQMIEEVGVTKDPKAIGYYSGFVEGVFALAQFCTVCFWGSLSDQIGRRPVLISGLCGVIGSTILFGTSKSFAMMIVSRALSGALSGNVAVIKSALAEITDETNQGAAFAYLPLCWSIGSLIAPTLGGFLSHPAERYPSLFNYELLRQYPFLLPCLVSSGLSTIGLIAGIFFFEETLIKAKQCPKILIPTIENSGPREGQFKTEGHSVQYDGASLSRSVDEPIPTMRGIIQNIAVRRVLISYAFMAYISVSLNAVCVLWLYTPAKLGGVGFSTTEIGVTLAVSGLLTTIVAVMVFPPIERWVGVVFLYRFGMAMQVVSVVTFPLARGMALAAGKRGAYFGASIMLSVRCIAGIVFVCNMLLVNRSAPSRRSLGTVNGLAQMVASASRALGPAAATSLFAISVQKNLLGGSLIWFVLAAIGMALAQIRSMLPSLFKQEELLIPEPPQRDPDNPDAPLPVVAHRLDFVKLGLPEYEHKFAMVIDNLFTPEDCARYIAKVESEKEWEQAAVNLGPNAQIVDTSYRNSSRILYDTEELAGEIFEKLKPYLKDIEYMGDSPLHRDYRKQHENPPAQWVTLNERLRFLKYGPGQFFRRHCDGIYYSTDRKQVSYYTLQLYLNGSADELKGGATRFWKSGKVDGAEKRKAQLGMSLRKFVDVEPRVGRALIFEQRGLVHSGEDVVKGTKVTVRTDLMFEARWDGTVKETGE